MNSEIIKFFEIIDFVPVNDFLIDFNGEILFHLN